MNNQIIDLDALFQQACEEREKTSKMRACASSHLWDLETQLSNLNEQIKEARGVYQALLGLDTAAKEFKTKIEILLDWQNKI